jgi:hypothetical protein
MTSNSISWYDTFGDQLGPSYLILLRPNNPNKNAYYDDPARNYDEDWQDSVKMDEYKCSIIHNNSM